ncbi:MAG: pyridoxal phosphate-dependent aminotransferase [Spirochaetales bacterium]|nr:pyridoxal phosphate-dependent aminotransferase [Spirochaetales bacterium]
MFTVKISTRDLTMQESPIRKLAPYADNAKKEGAKVYHLNIGQPDIKTPEAMLKAYSEVPDVIAYGPSNGLEEYREKLAQYYSDIGKDIGSENVFVTTGGSEAIIFTLLSALSPGDEVMIPEPFYTNYNGFAAMAGVSVVPVTTTIEDGFHLPSIEVFEKKLTDRTRAIMFSNPGNPTGTVFSIEELEGLVAFAKKNDLYLISDEAYREFTYGEGKAVSIMEFEGIDENAILIDSVSKRYSACGARIGWIITRNTKLLNLILKFGQARLCPPTVDQLAALAAMDTPRSYFDEVIREYKGRRDFAYEELVNIPGVVAKKPEGAFYMVVALPVRDADDFAKWLLSDFRIDGETTMVAPAEGFYSTSGLGQNQIRLAYVLNKDDLRKAINIIREGLKVYPGKL